MLGGELIISSLCSLVSGTPFLAPSNPAKLGFLQGFGGLNSRSIFFNPNIIFPEKTATFAGPKKGRTNRRPLYIHELTF